MKISSIFVLVIAAAGAPLSGPASAQGPTTRGGGDPGAWFDKADANHDSVVTRAEFAAFRSENFSRLDRNGDGVVSPADFPRLAKARPDAYRRLTAMLGEADTNHDGAVSRAELAAAPPVLFSIADVDHDGRVTRTEFDVSREKTRQRLERMQR
ncbi:MAG: hypothetical protein DI547_00360 [Sphingobium sp.]|nr:MAG: hypothetical protein DI547_00360 [Sphingobium sp.]